MTSGLLQVARSYKVAWSVAVLASILAGVCVAMSWKRQPATVDMVHSKVAALDTETRSKICAHRANNVRMYREALRIFDCIEIDIHIEPPAGGPAAVYHPPDENNLGLTLDFLLSHERLPAGRLWLDTKDLSQGNWKGYLEQLKRLIPPARRGDVIVETVWSDPEVHAASAAFRTGGFAFSYYLPTREAIDCAASRTQHCDSLRRQVLSTASMGFSHLSFDARAHEFVHSIRKDLPPGLKLLTWDLSKTWPKSELLGEVEVYIVNFPSKFAS